MVRQPCEKLSITEARTQPAVMQPHTITVSTSRLVKYWCTGVEKKIDGASELANAIGLMTSGEQVEITYIRGDRERTTRAELGQQVAQSSSGEDIHPGLAGATFATESASSTRGVEVVTVAEGSPAAQRDIRAGDIITAANRIPVESIADLAEVARSNSIIFLYINRGDRTLLRQVR